MESASLTPLGTVTFPSVRTYAVKVASFFDKKPPKNTFLNDYRLKYYKKTLGHLLQMIHLLKNDDGYDTQTPFLMLLGCPEYGFWRQGLERTPVHAGPDDFAPNLDSYVLP